MTELPKLGQPSTVSPQHTQYHPLYTTSYETPLRSYPQLDSGFYTGSSTMPPPPLPSTLSLTRSLGHPYADMQSLSSRSTSGNSALFDHGILKNPLDHLASAADAQTRQAGFRLPSDQLRQIISALNDGKQQQSSDKSAVPIAPMTPHLQKGHFHPVPTNFAVSDEGVRKTRAIARSQRDATDASMHLACTGFPNCTSDDLESGDVVHTTPLKGHDVVTDRDDSASLSSVDEETLRMFAPKDDHAASRTRKTSKITASERKKRNRSALSAHDANACGSPQRKISKGSVRGFAANGPSAKENELSIPE